MSNYDYIPETNQFRNTNTGRFASGIDAVRDNAIQQVETDTGLRFKLKGGSFVSDKSILRRTPEAKPYDSATVGERLIYVDDDGDVSHIRVYAPDSDTADAGVIRQGIERGIISEREYNNAPSNKAAADLVRERSIQRQELL